VAQLTSSFAIKPSLNPGLHLRRCSGCPEYTAGLTGKVWLQLHPGHNSICDVEPGQANPGDYATLNSYHPADGTRLPPQIV
jgi:hypothetical protein